jgi:glycosyltransferase involved in cell wall biosynthesis
MKKLKIAIMGIRGIPANYGGFETFAENIAPQLVERGHEVTVYGRLNFIDSKLQSYLGVRIIVLPTIRHKYFDTVAHTFLCVFHSLFRERFDVILICNSANSIFSFIPRLKGQKVAVNVDGLEWQRKKWNRIGQWVYRTSEFLATVLANQIVTDSKVIQEYYLKRFHKRSSFIPYGTPTEKMSSSNILDKFNLKPNGYILYVSRLEPENNAHLVVNAFKKIKTDKKLIIVGDAPYNSEYIQNLRKNKDPRIIFTGYIFGKGYHELQSHAYIYVQATQVGGTHPALLEGMGFGNCVLALDVPEHREVLEDAGVFFLKERPDDLTQKMQYLLDNNDEVNKYQDKAITRSRSKYSWEGVVLDYEKLFFKMC